MRLLNIHKILPFVLLLLPAACGGRGCSCGDREILAELVKTQGVVERDWSIRLEEWDKADVGAQFELGDGVRAGLHSGAELKLTQGPHVRLLADTRIRFLRSLTEKAVSGVDVETGEAEIIGGSNAQKLMIGIGLVELKPGTKIRIKKRDDKVQLHVAIGGATWYVEGEEDKKARVLKGGERIEVTIGEAVLVVALDEDERKPIPDMEPEAVEGTGGAEPDSGSANAKDDRPSPGLLLYSAPKQADFRVRGGETFTVHTARPPAVVEIDFASACTNGAVVQVSGKEGGVRGETSVNMAFPRGRTRYRVRCLNESGMAIDRTALKGSGIVLRDTGTARVQRKAPSSILDADGRTYRIFYQNRLPAITMRWSRAPAADSYRLHIDSERGGPRKIDLREPSHALRSGSLKEGTHKFRFEASGTPVRRSQTTTAIILFDNVAPKASVTAPKEGGFRAGARLQVRGMAARGWAVSIDRGKLSLDGTFRFSGEAVHTGKYRAIAIRLVHPRRGVHYYLRRASRAHSGGGE